MKLTEKQKLDPTAQQKIRKLNRCPFCQRGETWKKKTIYYCPENGKYCRGTKLISSKSKN